MATRRLGMSSLFGYERPDPFDDIVDRAERTDVIIRYRDLEFALELKDSRDYVEGIESQFDQGVVRGDGIRGPALGRSKYAYYFIKKWIRHKTYSGSSRLACPGRLSARELRIAESHN